MNVESKRLLQGLMRSEDTADIVSRTSGPGCNLTNASGEMKINTTRSVQMTDLMSGTMNFHPQKIVA